MSFSKYIGGQKILLSEKEEIYPKLNPVTMEDVTLHIPPDIDRLVKAFENKDLKDLDHELKSPGTPNEKKIGRHLANMTPETRKELMSKGMLKTSGNKLYITGDQVRNFVIHHYHQVAHETKGWELATEASPEAIKLIIDQGKKTGILPEDVNVRGTDKLEIIFGKNVYPVSSFPFVNYQDAPRMFLHSLKQNFTANALFYSPKEKKIYDFHGGLEDVRRQATRPIGSAKKKLKENPIYPLVLVRTHSMLNNGSVEESIKNEIKNSNISNADPQQVREEFLNGLKSSLNKQKYLKTLDELGLLSQVFRNLKVNANARIGDAKIPAVAVAQILEPNVPDFNGVREQLIKLSYPQTEANSVAFLLKLPYYNEHTANEFEEDRLKSGISLKTIEQFVAVNQLKNSRWLKTKLHWN